MTHVKICCIASVAEGLAALEAGADAIGLVSEMPSGPGVIAEDLIVEIAKSLSHTEATVLLTSLTEPQDIVAQWRRCGTDAVQLVDDLKPGDLKILRGELPRVKLIRVVHVEDGGALEEARAAAAEGPDYLLLDSGSTGLPVKELGGTGRTHDWSVSARIVASCPVPVYLAGGLNPDNVAAAIRAVRPYGVDVCSGVRTEDRLDAGKLSRFMAAVRSAA
jgi:phosphoribosylanthranilate isomerase